MGWFNIQQLKEPTAIQAVANGAGALGSALGAVTDKLGSIYNAERDRKYQMEQDRLKNERESAKNSAELGLISALEALRKAQEQKTLSDMEQGILNGASLRGYRQGRLALGKERNNIALANHDETKTHHRNTEDIQRSKSSSGGFVPSGNLGEMDEDTFWTLRDNGELNNVNSYLDPVTGKAYYTKDGSNIKRPTQKGSSHKPIGKSPATSGYNYDQDINKG